MSRIIEQLQKIDNFYNKGKCSLGQIEAAEQELGINFPEEYKDILSEFGAISFYATEWTGLNVDSYLNVVDITKNERKINAIFPHDCFVLENCGIEGLVVVANEFGEVFSVTFDKIQKIHDSIYEYLMECLKNNTSKHVYIN